MAGNVKEAVGTDSKNPVASENPVAATEVAPALGIISIARIRENKVALRTVQRDTETFQGLVDSIREVGVLTPITVRKQIDKESKEPYYELIDGLHRFAAAKDADKTEIPCHILSADDGHVLELQIISNIHKRETKPMEYSRQLKKILNMNPFMTEGELGKKLGKSSQWISVRLGLTKIDNPEVAKLIDNGKIVLSNAYALAKLPVEEIPNWVDRAITEPPDKFIAAATQRVKAINDAKRKGLDASKQAFEPVAHLRKLGDLKSENSEGKIGKILCTQLKPKNVEAAFALAIKFVLHLDPESLKAQEAKFDEQQQKRAEAKQKREVERAKKAKIKAEKTAKEAADAAIKAEEAAKVIATK